MSPNDIAVLDQILVEKRQAIAPDLSESEFFEFYSAQQILRDYSFSPTDIQKGVVGGGADGGIDSIYLLVDGRFVSDLDGAQEMNVLKTNVVIDLILIQSSQEKTFQVKRITRISEASENIFSLGRSQADFTERYNELLLEAIERFRTAHRVLVSKYPKLNVSYFYVTKGDTGEISDLIRNIANGVADKTKGLLATVTQASFHFVGARELIELAIKPPRTTSPLKYVGHMDSPKGGYATFVRLSDFYDFITKDDQIIDHLFDFNVRDYQNDVEVNKGIRKTLTSPAPHAEDFWWLNNGITIVATRVLPGGHRELVIEDPSIVNGLQTSHEIIEHFRGKSVEDRRSDDRHALVRIIASDNIDTQDSIIRATNSQTGIGPASLWATDPIHRDLERLFPLSGLYYDRRKSYWRNKDKPLAEIVSIQDLAQSVISMVLAEPDSARARPSKYFKTKNATLYRKVFAKSYSTNLYTACALTRKKAESFLRTIEADSHHRNNLIFYVLYVSGCLATEEATPSHKTLSKVLTISPIDNQLLSKALEIVRPLYVNLGADDKAAKGSELVRSVKSAMENIFPKKGERHEQETI